VPVAALVGNASPLRQIGDGVPVDAVRLQRLAEHRADLVEHAGERQVALVINRRDFVPPINNWHLPPNHNQRDA
jgi:hypothetical protein